MERRFYFGYFTCYSVPDNQGSQGFVQTLD